MDATLIAFLVVGAFSAWLVRRIEHKANKRTAAALDRLERWRSAWDETDRWLAEFPDVEQALAHLKANAEGHGGTNIMGTRAIMRARRDLIEKRMPAEQKQAALDRIVAAAPTGVAYQHLSAECDDCDDTPAPMSGRRSSDRLFYSRPNNDG